MACINKCLSSSSQALRIASKTVSRPLFQTHTKHISRFHATHRTFATKLPVMQSPVSSTPLATLGANPEIAKEIQTLLLPEYDLVHICTTPADATAELPSLCAGNLETTSASGLGSNVTLPLAERRVPKAIIFGGGIPEEQVNSVMEAVRAKAENVKVVRVTRDDILARGAAGPSPKIIVEVLRTKLDEMVAQGAL